MWMRGDACLAVEIGKRAGDTKRPVIATCAKSQGIGGLAQKRASGDVRGGDIFEQPPVAIGIGACPRMFQSGEALGLDCASRSLLALDVAQIGHRFIAWVGRR